MTVVNDIATAVSTAISGLPAVRSTVRIDAPASRDVVESVTMKLPGVIVSVLEDGFSTRAGRDDPRKGSVDIAATVVTRPLPSGKGDGKYASAWVQAWTIQEAIKVLVTGNDWGLSDKGVATAFQPVSRPVAKVGLKTGHAAIVIGWEQEYDTPGDDLTDLRDLETVVADIDFAHLAPDGETPPDGTVDHTTQIDDLDA